MASTQPLKQRTRPMEVLVLGLCRTGTISMQSALRELGYEGVYHMTEIMVQTEHAKIWTRALEAKYEGKGEPLSKAEWDDLLGEYSAGTDIPMAIFVDELIAAYPDAKIILTTRSADSWHRSVLSTVFAAVNIGGVTRQLVALLSPLLAQRIRMLDLIFEHLFYDDFRRFGRRAFLEHNEHVRRVAPKERFLEFEAVQGWAPLCAFLGKEVPDVPYPRLNDTQDFRRNFGLVRKQQVSKVVDVVAVVLPVAVAVMWNWARLRKLLTA